MPKRQEVKTYEIPVWFRLGGDGAAEDQALAEIRRKLASAGAEILHETKAIKRRLAYPVAKTREGMFVIFDAEMNPAETSKIREAFLHDAAVIRIGIFEKIARAQIYPERRLTRPRLETPSTQKEVKMEELDKKLEEILHESR